MMHNSIWYLVESGTSLFEIIIILTFLRGFLEPKEITINKKILVSIWAFSQLFVVSSFLYNIPNILIINFFTVSMILSIMLHRGKLIYHTFICILLLAVLVIIELLSVVILVLCLDIQADIFQNNPFYKFIGVTFKNILSFVAIKIICFIKKSHIHEAQRGYFIFLLVVPIISIAVAIIILNLIMAYKIEINYFILIAYLGLMYINAITFGIYEHTMRQLDKEYKYKLIEKQLELQLNHYNKLAENREILAEVIHDFKNHLNCIYNLYKYNKGSELGSYIENLITVSSTENVIDTGNPVIDALLNEKASIAEKMGIEFKLDLNLPSNIRIAYTDLCVVLGNSLDNAIEACKRITEKTQQKSILLSINYRDSYMVIVVSNSCDRLPIKGDTFFRSSKPSPELHGLGLQSIERTVKKYNGNMVIKYDKNLFQLELVMSTA